MTEWIIVFYIVLGGLASVAYLIERARRKRYQGLAWRWANAYKRDVPLKQPKQREEGDEWKNICGYP